MTSVVKNLKCILQLNIHYYPNRRYKSYITSLKAVIVVKSLISAGLNITKILHFVFYDKILQNYGQHWVRKFYWHILSKNLQISKKCKCVGGRGVTPPSTHTHTHTHSHTLTHTHTHTHKITHTPLDTHSPVDFLGFLSLKITIEKPYNWNNTTKNKKRCVRHFMVRERLAGAQTRINEG